MKAHILCLTFVNFESYCSLKLICSFFLKENLTFFPRSSFENERRFDSVKKTGTEKNSN